MLCWLDHYGSKTLICYVIFIVMIDDVFVMLVLYLQLLRTRDDERETICKTYQNKLTSIFRRCERDCYINMLEVQSSNIKVTLYTMIGIIKTKTRTEYPHTIIHENKSVNSKIDI